LANRTYERAINRLLDARDICPAKKTQVNALIKKAFQQIEGEKRAAEALADERKARQAVEKEKQRALDAERRADSALQVTRRVLNQMYFYEGKFGLTVKNVAKAYDLPKYRFGYIDRMGREVIPFRFEKATAFSTIDGFARVEIDKQAYLLDTTGTVYRLAESLDALNDETEALDLHENPPKNLPDSIGRFQKLKVLLYYGSSTKTSLPESIGSLINLVYLDLSRLQLSSLPESFGQLRQVQRLKLRDNRLISLPSSFGQLSQLQYLDLGLNQLVDLPESFGQLRKCEYLDLSDNQLDSLPQSFGQLAQLQFVDIGLNQLRSLPQSFGNLQSLEHLYMGLNRLNSLPDNFGQLQQLKMLSMRYNRLTSLPDNFGELRQLKGLYMSDNKLQTLPENFGQLEQIEVIFMSDNQLKTLPESIGMLQQIQEFHVETNLLQTLPENLCALPTLNNNELTAIRKNPLQAVPDCWLERQSFHGLINFAWASIGDTLYSVGKQSLAKARERFPKEFAERIPSFRKRLAKINKQTDPDLIAIREMLKP
ncbi:MAG: WG repeat-containing protein, partial [Bacteroidota bacterium]